MSRAASLISRQGEDAVRTERRLGARDAETEWPAVGYIGIGDFSPDDFDCDDFNCFVSYAGDVLLNTIRVFVVPDDEIVDELDAGLLTVSRFKILTGDLIEYLDHITYKGDTYVIDTVPQVHYLRGVVQYRNATMMKVT